MTPARRIIAVVLALASTFAAPACGKSDPPGGGTAATSGSAAPGEAVDVLLEGSPEELKAFRKLANAYEKARPGKKVRLVEAADRDDLLTRLSTSFAGGRAPDLFLLNYRYYGQFSVKDVLEPLGPRLDTSKVFTKADFFPQALDAFTRDGVVECMPMNLSSLVVYVNKDIFAKAGVALPEPGWTWATMVEKAEQLTKDFDGDGVADQYGLGVEPALLRVAPFVWSNGGDIVDDPGAPTRLTFDTPEAKEALQEFLDLKFVDGVIPNELEFEATDNETRFVNNRLAMVLQSRKSTSLFRTITAFDWDVAPLPAFDRPAGVLHSDGFCMPKSAPHRDDAWAFLEYALGPEGAPVLAATGRTVPSLISVANSPAFLDPKAKPASSKVFLDAAPSVRHLPVVSNWPAIEKEVDTIIEVALWRERKPVDQVVQELDDATRPLFAASER